MKRDHEFAAGPSLQPRLTRVDEEDESESGAEAYSDAGSGREYGYHTDSGAELLVEAAEGLDDEGERFYTNGLVDGKGRGVDYDDRLQDHVRRRPSKAGEQEASRSWADLDLSMIVALVSPIGNWLTGSDHVKNVFLLLFLIFYLHQLIEGAL